jgi:hypothetical protein
LLRVCAWIPPFPRYYVDGLPWAFFSRVRFLTETSGTKAVLAIALSLAFGVVLVVLRGLMRYVDSAFVRIVCFASFAVIMSVF